MAGRINASGENAKTIFPVNRNESATESKGSVIERARPNELFAEMNDAIAPIPKDTDNISATKTGEPVALMKKNATAKPMPIIKGLGATMKNMPPQARQRIQDTVNIKELFDKRRGIINEEDTAANATSRLNTQSGAMRAELPSRFLLPNKPVLVLLKITPFPPFRAFFAKWANFP
jgi:hypothetical protein